MAITITEIRNLTDVKIPPITKVAKLSGFDSQGDFTDTIINTKATLTDWDGFTSTDNIQVTWSDENKKVIYRGVGGFLKKEGEASAGKGTITISNLTDVSKFSLGLNGQIEIGPKVATPTDPVAVISVRIGNLNPRRDWIIDLSDRQDEAAGTSVRLDSLIAWAGGQTGDDTTAVAIPQTGDEASGDTPELKDFTVEFNAFNFNVTQKTFDIDVSSKKGDAITFGALTIKNVGFRVTNEAVAIPAVETSE